MSLRIETRWIPVFEESVKINFLHEVLERIRSVSNMIFCYIFLCGPAMYRVEIKILKRIDTFVSTPVIAEKITEPYCDYP